MANDCKAVYIEKSLSEYNRRTLAATPRLAAVLLLLLPEKDGCSVILTKRKRNLEHHGGEVSFPGGIMEKGDSDISFTALRETEEEIGINQSDIRLVGALDDELSRWGHRVTPYVGITENSRFVPAETEVDRLYRIPLPYLTDPGIKWTEKWFRGKDSRTVYFFRYNNDIVWGLTALILHKFLKDILKVP